MNYAKRFSAILLCILLIFTLAACDNTGKKYIYFSLVEQPSTIDPQTAQSDIELTLVHNIFEGLLRKDENGKIVNGIAESYKKDGLLYTFYLRKNAKWSNEEIITAYDFQFAFRRAVTPKTQAPFSKRLLCIKNADLILKGKKSVTDLGVKAIDTYVLQIKLAYEDKNFEETLTTSIAMPCNETFFKEASGKYGLEKETTLSCGSYRLAKWDKAIFGIRLYRSKTYTGNFKAKNAAVFFSSSKERKNIDVLKESDADIAFIDSYGIAAANQAGLKTATNENICWFLTISDGFSKEIRKSLMSLASPKLLNIDLPEGYSIAQSIYPPSLKVSNATVKKPNIYDSKTAKKHFSAEVLKMTDKKFPTGVVLYYYDDGFSKNIVTDIVSRWQNQLSAFINIKPVSSYEVLISQLKEQTNALSIFPVFSNSQNPAEYLEKFGIDYKKENLSKIQTKLLKSNNIFPLITQKTAIAYQPYLSNVNLNNPYNLIDFAYVVKNN